MHQKQPPANVAMARPADAVGGAVCAIAGWPNRSAEVSAKARMSFASMVMSPEVERSGIRPEWPDTVGAKSARGLGNEFQRNTVDAVALARWFWAIWEDMPLMPATPAAVDFRAGHEQGVVAGRANGLVFGFPETGPAGPAVELGRR